MVPLPPSPCVQVFDFGVSPVTMVKTCGSGSLLDVKLFQVLTYQTGAFLYMLQLDAEIVVTYTNDFKFTADTQVGGRPRYAEFCVYVICVCCSQS